MYSKLKERFIYLFFHVQYDWQIGLVHMQPAELLQKGLGRVHWLKQPFSSFWADPFLLYDGNHYVLFLEDYIKEKGYGNISYIVFDKQWNETERGIAIDEGLHFSFPNVFMHEGNYYMVPEAAAKGYLALYKCVSFPGQWVEEKVLLNQPCADAIFYVADDKWYLFYSKDDESRNQSLYMRCGDDLFCDWEIKKEILAKSGITNTRCAGNFFEVNGQCYRPAQNCKDYYGQSVVINKVNHLSPESFSETSVQEIKGPLECEKGFHSFNHLHGVIAVDGRVRKIKAKSFSEIISSFITKFIRSR